MNIKTNSKILRLKDAKKAFIEDLLNDKDYINYRSSSHGFGVVTAYQRVFIIDKAVSSEKIITAFNHHKI